MSNNRQIKHICEIGVGHIGVCFSALHWNDTNLKFTLFEPNKKYYKEISVAATGKPNVTIHNVAICDFDGEIELCEKETSSYVEGVQSVMVQCEKNMYGHNFIPENKYKVRASKLSNFDKGDIDLLLLDTEGGEWFALKNLISRPYKINIETHHSHAAYLNPYLYEIEEWMVINNYKKIRVTHSDSEYVRL